MSITSPPTKGFPYVELAVAPEAEDLAAGLLLAAGAEGIESRDDETMVRAPGEAILLVAWFEVLAEAEVAAERARAALGAGCLGVATGEAEDPGWRLAWREHFGPMRFGTRLWVVPPGETEGVGPDEVAVELLPSAAFGAGTHETTSLILDLVDELLWPGATVLDVGCGSGILALAALRLGAARARAVDVDPEAIEAARENALRNRLASRIRIDATPVQRLRGAYDLVLANLSLAELPPLVPSLAARVAAGGSLVWSGLLVGQVDELPAPPGLALRETRRRGEWAAQVFDRTAPER